MSGLETKDLFNMRSLFKETSDSVSCIFQIVLPYRVKINLRNSRQKTALKAGSLLHCHGKEAESPWANRTSYVELQVSASSDSFGSLLNKNKEGLKGW